MATLLVIDPSPIITEPLAATFRQAGYEVLCASNTNDALAMTSVRIPDLVIMELQFPGSDGLVFLRRLRADPEGAKIPVILLTAVTDRTRLKEAVAHNIFGIMLKQGFSLSVLMQKAGIAIANHHAEAHPTTPPARPTDNQTPDNAATHHILTDRPLHPFHPASSSPDSAAQTQNDDAKTLASLKPIVYRSEINKVLDSATDIKAFSATVAHILRLTESSTCSIDQLVDAVKMDHALALKVLKLANSSIYARGEPVDTIKQAVLRIGITETRQAVMNISVIDAFSSGDLIRNIDCNQFWEHGIACGLIAAEIAHALERTDIDAAFTMGLLHDVGRLVLADQLGDRYAQVLETARAHNLPLEQVEKRLLLFDHAEVMDRILRAWHFPRQLIRPIALHHTEPKVLRKVAFRELEEAAMLSLADRLAHCLMLGSSGNNTLYPTAELVEILKLPDGALDNIENNIPDQTNDMKFSLLATSDIAAWPQTREILQSEIKHEFRPLYLNAGTHKSALTIFFRRLRNDLDEGKPNIAIVKVNAAREMRTLSQNLLDAETAAATGPLPLVILSPAARLALEPGVMADRLVRRLPFPITTSRLFQGISELLRSRRSTLPHSHAA